MDSAYDHIQEESYPQDPTRQQAGGDGTHQETANNFNAEIQDAYKAISSSPWAARLGGFLGTVKKQGEQYYDSASKQYAPLSKTATAGVSNLITHARKLSVQAGDIAGPAAKSTDKDASFTTVQEKEDLEAHPDRPESLPADIVKEAEGILSRFRSEATKRLKDIEKAEDAADEALLKFGSNLRNFLRDAVTIAPPESGSEAHKNGEVLFESKDSSGKKVVHATRFDAQLHVIHSTLDSFLKDPTSPQWDEWKSNFDVEKKTDAIAKDLEKHEELRSAMEKCVPEKVDYANFWVRYYFLRHVIESEEQRRREMLKASAPAADEEVGWDEDSEEEEDDDDASSSASTSNPTPPNPTSTEKPSNKSATSLAASVKTLKPSDDKPAGEELLKPAQPRRSNDEKSVADSDASYDLVSGATSKAPGSPQQVQVKKKGVAEESEEEDSDEEESDEEESDEEESEEEEDWE
ncbi:BSD-domain-containing protein [Cucurbitaria berberidis CBS 394.84]|uniref:BSD-domain-containing protein n=1 Tax=Cucurbitaria berberidis CBS 394.84 TaxID=1168544 RepID=A0A9P4LCT2_9PLEO|nr:BSD-domain-containing protein [Cucurbitaria berberidis CBS 394.84]KAF1850340.1 BSD-domain-containing protein [Cucurbitaria berberidis CBS 394.84]